jgi:hypothetical protein
LHLLSWYWTSSGDVSLFHSGTGLTRRQTGEHSGIKKQSEAIEKIFQVHTVVKIHSFKKLCVFGIFWFLERAARIENAGIPRCRKKVLPGIISSP